MTQSETVCAKTEEQQLCQTCDGCSLQNFQRFLRALRLQSSLARESGDRQPAMLYCARCPFHCCASRIDDRLLASETLHLNHRIGAYLIVLSYLLDTFQRRREVLQSLRHELKCHHTG